MGSNNVRGIATSNYRQLRVTVTQELSGRLSYSVYAKPLNKQWNEHHCVVRDTIDYRRPIKSQDDVIDALIEVLKEQLLPGIG